MLIGSDGVHRGAVVELGLSSFGALGTRVSFATVWHVADVQELTVGAAAAVTVEITADGWGLQVLSTWWLRSGGRGVRCSWQGREGVIHGGAKGLGRLRPCRAGEGGMVIEVAVYAVGKGLLLQNAIV